MQFLRLGTWGKDGVDTGWNQQRYRVLDVASVAHALALFAGWPVEPSRRTLENPLIARLPWEYRR